MSLASTATTLHLKPYTTSHKYGFPSKITTLEKALKASGIKNGMTLSFHHQLRNGDYVVNKTLDIVRELGIKSIRLAQTALFGVHEPVIDFIKDGTVTRIEGSLNEAVGEYVSYHPLSTPVVLRSHGGRWAAVKTGELHVDIAIIAAHSHEGDTMDRTPEAIIVHHCDFIDFDIKKREAHP